MVCYGLGRPIVNKCIWGISDVTRPVGRGLSFGVVRFVCGVLEMDVRWCVSKGEGRWMKVGMGKIFG